MKRLSTGALAALFAIGMGISAVAAPSGQASSGNLGNNVIAQASPMASPAAVPAMNFGSPPSGAYPILYNDHHVYARPDVLKQGRVLAALVRGGTILVPLRSMFEQMGATVSYDPASKTVDVTKSGSDVKVTVGKPEVVINGETRPLDVPPIIYQGTILVPVRVISEGMGAYVQWVPDKRVVVVRYIPPAAPTAAPPPPPPPPPPPSPTPVPAPFADHFIAGDYVVSAQVYNEFSPGNTGKGGYGGASWAARGAYEFNLMNLPWMIAGDWRSYGYPHNSPGTFTNNPPACNLAPPAGAQGTQGCVTVIGGYGQTWVHSFSAMDSDVDARLGLKVLDPRIYIGVGYLWRWTNYGYPKMQGVGFGVEKLPDLNQPFSVYGSAWYYPSVTGTYTIQSGPQVGTNISLGYNILKYQVGATVDFGSSPVFVDFGWLGDRGNNKQNAPSNFTHNGGYIGLGIHF